MTRLRITPAPTDSARRQLIRILAALLTVPATLILMWRAR